MKSTKLKIWHVGNWCIQFGQTYVESPFEAPSKDVEVINYAKPFVDALKAIPNAEVISQPSWELYHMSPEEFNKRLKWATSIIFTDVETKCLMLHPDFFMRSKWQNEMITFPDRFDILKEWVKKGGHFHMNGGWLSFSGELGKGGWGRSRFHEALPVECILHDDLVESTDGFEVRSKLKNHWMIKGIDWSTIPPLLGFNECRLRKDSKCLVEIKNMGKWHPLLAMHNYGNGVVTCWMTGASPHWGINFMKWKEYNKFWQQVFNFGK